MGWRHVLSAAELLANAAGGRGVWRRRWVGFPVLDVRCQGSLAKARQPFAVMPSPVGTGVKRNGMTKDPDNLPRAFHGVRCDAAAKPARWILFPLIIYQSRFKTRVTAKCYPEEEEYHAR